MMGVATTYRWQDVIFDDTLSINFLRTRFGGRNIRKRLSGRDKSRIAFMTRNRPQRKINCIAQFRASNLSLGAARINTAAA
jgi:hypothetical protein